VWNACCHRTGKPFRGFVKSDIRSSVPVMLRVCDVHIELGVQMSLNNYDMSSNAFWMRNRSKHMQIDSWHKIDNNTTIDK
jgi:hypothetical protein